MSVPYTEDKIVLSPGERRTRALSGNKFSLYTATGPVELAFGEQTEFFAIKAGRSIPGPDGGFEIVRFYNPGAVDITVEFAVSIADVRPFDVTISGSSAIPVRGGGSVAQPQVEMIVSNVAVLILAANANRTSAIIYAGTDGLFTGPNNAVTAGDVPTVPSGGSMSIGHKGAVFGIRKVAGTIKAAAYEEVA